MRPARASADFRGTSLYSSLHSHEARDLGRRDDLWALWYVLLELLRGALPWKCVKEDRARCEAAKRWYRARPAQLTAGLPGERHLLALHAHLESLSFAAAPDYALIAACLQRALAEAAAQGSALARCYAPYQENELFHTPPPGAVPFAAATVAAAAAEAEAVVTEALAEEGVPARTAAAYGAAAAEAVAASAVPAPVLCWSAELRAACHPSAATLAAIRLADASGESAELAALFDLSGAAMSCDEVLASRGGGGLAAGWETDKDGTPVHAALRVEHDTLAAKEADTGAHSPAAAAAAAKPP